MPYVGFCDWRAPRARIDSTFSAENGVFGAFFRIGISVLGDYSDVRRRSRRSFPEECTGFEMHLKDRHSIDFLMS